VSGHLQISPYTGYIRKGKVQLSLSLQNHKMNGRVGVKVHTLLTLEQYPTVGFTLRLFYPHTDTQSLQYRSLIRPVRYSRYGRDEEMGKAPAPSATQSPSSKPICVTINSGLNSACFGVPIKYVKPRSKPDNIFI
jgi:hypothetical protein